FGPLPPAVIEHLGQSFGSRRSAEHPNLLRAFSCTRALRADAPEDWVVVAEADIDDSTPEEVAYLQEELFRAGALDVFVTPIYMKKNRPAFHVTAVASEETFEEVARAFLVESSTFGLRYTRWLRRCLQRELHTVATPFGGIRVKTGLYRGRPVKRVPEYEDCREAAHRAKVPFRQVYDRARAAAERAAEAGPADPPGTQP
ncbi:MAG: nickel insertion protein, partial [Spirochaetota bacterium]